MIEYFAITCNKLEEKLVEPIKRLNPDLIQLPFHLRQPSVDLINKINDFDIEVVGKWVTPKNFHNFNLAFFIRLVEQYKNVIKMWDFGGEPETRPSQPGCRWYGTAQEYIDQLKMFVDVVKTSNPFTLVGSGGFLSATFNGFYGNEDRSDFLRKLFDLGLGEMIDYISVNSYLYGYGGTKNVIAGIGKMKEIMAWYHCTKPIIIAETGVPVAGDPRFLHIIQTEERQANSIVETHVLFHSVGIDWLVWFQLFDSCWGLMYEDEGKLKYRKGFDAYKTMVSMLKNYVFVKRFKAYPSRTVEERWKTDKVEWHVFQKDEEEIHVIWVCGGESVTAKITVPMKIYNKYGEELVLDKEFTFIEPVYLKAKKGVVHNLNFMLE